MEAQRAADQEQGQLQQTLQEAIRMIGQLSAQVNSQQAQLSELTQQEAARRRISDVSDLSGILPTRQLLEQQQVAGRTKFDGFQRLLVCNVGSPLWTDVFPSASGFGTISFGSIGGDELQDIDLLRATCLKLSQGTWEPVFGGQDNWTML